MAGMYYNPGARANDFHVEYMVNTTGDRWFITGFKGAGVTDLTQCDKLAGDTADGTPAASETVA